MEFLTFCALAITILGIVATVRHYKTSAEIKAFINAPKGTRYNGTWQSSMYASNSCTIDGTIIAWHHEGENKGKMMYSRTSSFRPGARHFFSFKDPAIDVPYSFSRLCGWVNVQYAKQADGSLTGSYIVHHLFFWYGITDRGTFKLTPLISGGDAKKVL